MLISSLPVRDVRTTLAIACECAVNKLGSRLAPDTNYACPCLEPGYFFEPTTSGILAWYMKGWRIYSQYFGCSLQWRHVQFNYCARSNNILLTWFFVCRQTHTYQSNLMLSDVFCPTYFHIAKLLTIEGYSIILFDGLERIRPALVDDGRCA